MPPVLRQPRMLDLLLAYWFTSNCNNSSRKIARAYPQFFKHSFEISKTDTQFQSVPFRPRFVPFFQSFFQKNFKKTRTYFFHLSLQTPRKFVKFKQKLSQELFRPSHHGITRRGGGGDDTPNWHSVNYAEIGHSRNGRAPRRCYVPPTAEQRAGNLWHGSSC